MVNALPQSLIVYIFFSALAALVSLAQVVFIAREKHIKGRFFFIGFLLSVAAWSFFAIFQVSSASLWGQVFWSKFQYLGVAPLTVFWCLFVGSRTETLSFWRKQSAFLFVIPTLTAVFAFTNEWHGLIWKTVSLDTSGVFPLGVFEHGLWFDFIHAPYSYFFTALSVVSLLNALRFTPKAQRASIYSLLLAVFIPLLSVILYLSNVIKLDMAPTAFAISGLAITWSMIYQRFHTRVLLAHRSVLNSIDDAVFVLDKDYQLVDMNQAAKVLLAYVVQENEQTTRGYFGSLISRCFDFLDITAIERLKSEGLSLEKLFFTKFVAFRVLPIPEASSYSLLIANDITEQKLAAKKIEHQFNKLEAIVETSELLRSLASLEDVYEELMNTSFRMTKAEYCAILEYDLSRDQFCVSAAQSSDGKVLNELLGTNLKRNTGLSWLVLEQQKTIHIKNPQPLKPAFYKFFDMKDFIASPIRGKAGEIVAVITINICLQDARFTESDVAFIEAIAQAGSSAVSRLLFMQQEQARTNEYKQLLIEAERRSDELDLINHINTLMASEQDALGIILKTSEVLTGTEKYDTVKVSMVSREDAQETSEHSAEQKFEAMQIKQVFDSGEARWSVLKQNAEVQEISYSRLLVPCFRKELVNNVISFDLKAKHLDEHNKHLLLRLARQVTIALERAQLYQEIRLTEQQFRLITNSMNDIIILHKFNGNYSYVSPSCEKTMGYTKEVFLNTKFFSIVHPEDLPFLKNSVFPRLAQGEELKPFQYRAKKASGEYAWFETFATPIKDHAERVTGFVSSSRDVSERKQMQEQMLEGALLYDSLTSLPNRTLFTDRLEHALRKQGRQNTLFAVLFIDLDRFKVINDSLGHSIGDQLLVQTAGRLQEIVRTDDTVARLGGDEFAIILEAVSIEEASFLAERIGQSLQKPFAIEGYPVLTSASIGITMSDHIADSDELLRAADLAMYHVKTNGKANYALYNAEMQQHVRETMQLELDLRGALENNEFHLVFQPIFVLDSLEMAGVEALIRWRHKEKGLIPPSVFIPIAEEVGLIHAIDDWVLRQASAQIAAWNNEHSFINPLTVSVNLSTKNFGLSNLCERVESALQASQLVPELLKLEITESVIMENADIAQDSLLELRAKGITLQVDDFGTGYSSLSYLHKLPLQSLKIDRSFVQALPASEQEEAIVASIVALAKTLRLDVVAEGIETAAQLEHIKRLGSHYGQGYYLSKPMTKKAIENSFFSQTKEAYQPKFEEKELV